MTWQARRWHGYSLAPTFDAPRFHPASSCSWRWWGLLLVVAAVVVPVPVVIFAAFVLHHLALVFATLGTGAGLSVVGDLCRPILSSSSWSASFWSLCHPRRHRPGPRPTHLRRCGHPVVIFCHSGGHDLVNITSWSSSSWFWSSWVAAVVVVAVVVVPAAPRKCSQQPGVGSCHRAWCIVLGS